MLVEALGRWLRALLRTVTSLHQQLHGFDERRDRRSRFWNVDLGSVVLQDELRLVVFAKETLAIHLREQPGSSSSMHSTAARNSFVAKSPASAVNLETLVGTACYFWNIDTGRLGRMYDT